MSGQPQPPQPPPFERRIHMSTLQKIGIPLLLLLPVLALFGVFGGASTTQRVANDELVLQVTYPTRTRYNLFVQVAVDMTNLTTEPVTLTVEFDHTYIDQFAGHVFLPDVQNVAPDAYRVEVPDVLPGEQRIVTVGMRAENFWRHTGQVTASAAERPPLTVTLDTWVFP